MIVYKTKQKKSRKGKKKSGQVKKAMQQAGKVLIKINKPNTSNKRQKNHLSLTPDSSLSIQTPNMPITDWPVEIPTPVSP